MLDILTQVSLTVLTLTALACTQLSTKPAHHRWAPVFGLLSAPFWIYAGWSAEQYGTLATSLVTALLWLRGLHLQWCTSAVNSPEGRPE